MRNAWTVLFLGVVFLLAMSSGALATSKCDGADIANGPFMYAALGVTQATFNGSGGATQSSSFSITAPSVNPSLQNVDIPDVFPGEGQQPCAAQAPATIGVLEIQKVGDADGNPIDPVDVDPSSTLGQNLSGAFALTPSSFTFNIGATVTVGVTITNPNIDATYYGDYDVKLAAQAPGYGIGVGNGLHILLSLRAPTATDTTPPVVTVTKPTGDEILGVISVEIQAYDPDTLPVATGLASMSATVSSGKTVKNLSIPLTLDHVLPVGAGVTVTGTGSFIPTGGTGSAGTTDALAFTSSSPSGIGSYTINAQATDGAGNIGYASKSFNVKYDVTFTKVFSTNKCQTSAGTDICTGQFQFTVNRSNQTSDGAFMYDKTVVVQLVSNGSVVATHTYGTGDIKECVKIDTVYQTNFKRADIGATSFATYKARVLFLDVDGNLMQQAESADVIF